MKTLRQSTWALPALLSLATCIGLVLALVAEGVWDWIAWALVVLPLIAILWAWLERRA